MTKTEKTTKMNDQQSSHPWKRCLRIAFYVFLLQCYVNFLIVYHVIYTPYIKNVQFVKSYRNGGTTPNPEFTKYTWYREEVLPMKYYKYPIVNSTRLEMDYEKDYNSSYYWFVSKKDMFRYLGYHTSKRVKNRPICLLNMSRLGPIEVDKTEIKLEWVEQQNRNVRFGGYNAPRHCRSSYRVAVIVPYRNRKDNLNIFLRYIHPLLKKQLLEYRIFVIEQHGMEKFNKGALYNIAFLETQRFGTWDCLIFHDVDLVPEDERILYTCPKNPTHMSSAIEIFNYVEPQNKNFGGVISITPDQYNSVNGYSNFYWNSNGENDDFYDRILSKKYSIERYNSSIARYATLNHLKNKYDNERNLFLLIAKLRFLKEGLRTVKYNLVRVTNRKLYTHILADVNPTKMKLDTKTLMREMVNLQGKPMEYGRQELGLKSVSFQDLQNYLIMEQRRARRREMTRYV